MDIGRIRCLLETGAKGDLHLFKGELHTFIPAGNIGGVGLIVDWPHRPLVIVRMAEAPDCQVIRDGDVQNCLIPKNLADKLSLDQLHQRIQAVQRQSVRKHSPRKNLLNVSVLVHNVGHAADLHDLGLRGLLDMLDKFFQHGFLSFT